ncbi:amidase [Cupriavidus sp. USMAA2-4]|uniref:amidase family protein n=1 Tax=Cupriavidus sp. USMAA2-4 TaxID=876364 RepID=UPI0008A6A194|nr:amidase family protein [Cupriavidus sp. USMAA2-4]AOY95605.1 amidase [Cupriavidus sp. USMAA2-4]
MQANSAGLPDLAPLGAAELARALAAGHVSALAACDAAIARIEAGDGAINAVVVRDFERARAQARAADAALARGERRPLLGVPITVKESFGVAGLPSTWGLAIAQQARVTEDAVAVARLKAAGAVLLGKTNVPVVLADYQSRNPVYGLTRHPHDLLRTPGGSSGGAAAALAAGFVPLELGSDIGGSIRVPAHFCGVCGHKPSHGLVPTRGHDFPGYPSAPDVLSVAGPLARRVADLELALEVLAGPDREAAAAYRLALPAARRDGDMRGLRVLALDAHPLARASAAVRGAVATAAERLAAGGAEVARHSEWLPDLATLHEDYARILLTITTRGGPNPPPSISAHEWLGLMDRRMQWQNCCRRLFEAFDVVLMPPFGSAAFPHIDSVDWDATTLDLDGEPALYREQLAWAGLATLPGLPATVVPVATDAQGLPLGVQVVGPLLEDRTPLAVARWLQESGA